MDHIICLPCGCYNFSQNSLLDTYICGKLECLSNSQCFILVNRIVSNRKIVIVESKSDLNQKNCTSHRNYRSNLNHISISIIVRFLKLKEKEK